MHVDRLKLEHELLLMGAVQYGEVTLSSGLKAPIYANLRSMRSFPKQLALAADILWSMTKTVHHIADVPTGITPVVTTIALRHDASMVTPREPKKHGSQATIDGYYHPGDSVALFDDVATSGGSLLRYGKILRQAGLIAHDVYVIVDREEGAEEALRHEGFRLHSIFTLYNLAHKAMLQGKFTETQWATIERYRQNPDSYADNREVRRALVTQRAMLEAKF